MWAAERTEQGIDLFVSEAIGGFCTGAGSLLECRAHPRRGTPGQILNHSVDNAVVGIAGLRDRSGDQREILLRVGPRHVGQTILLRHAFM